MNHILSLLFLLSLSLLLAIDLQAQDDLNTIFSDTDAKEIDQVIKWNAGAMVFSDCSFQYEKMLGDFFSLEVGLGATLGYPGWQFGNIFEEDYTLETETLRGGFSYSAAAKMYFLAEGPIGVYMSPMYLYRKREFSTRTIEHHYFLVNGGIQQYLANQIVLEYYFGAGYRSSSVSGLPLSMYPDKEQTQGAFAVSASIKIGYAF